MKEAAKLLANAERPVIVVDRAARTENGVRLLVQLAEALQARVVDMGGRMNFPKTHYLSAGLPVVSNADVIIGMELTDFWAVVNSFVDNGDHGIGINQPRMKPDTKLISINSVDLNTKANYQDFQRFQAVDIAMAADAETTLPSLIEAVKAAIPNDRKAAIEKRGEAARRLMPKRTSAPARRRRSPGTQARSAPRDCRWRSGARSRISTGRWSRQTGNVSNWPHRLWPMEKHHHWLGHSGGYGVGYGAPAAVGAALANRDLGRFSVSSRVTAT